DGASAEYRCSQVDT
ncbi:hypothetical protein A2U01_0068738, partial [Trifolium medium]|nr:hypothetical protein [Trifolium medium]